MLNNVNDAVVATDAQFRFTAWNRGAEKLYGWNAEDVLGRHLLDVFKSELTDAQRLTAMQGLIATGRYQSEVRQYMRSGQPIDIEAITLAIRDEAGQVSGYVSVNRDISARKRAEAEARCRTAYAEALARMAAQLNAQLELNAVVETVCAEPARAMHVPVVARGLYDAARTVRADCRAGRRGCLCARRAGAAAPSQR